MVASFEEKVLMGLKNCNININESHKVLNIGAAVSGGADSVSLLLALSKLSTEYNFNIFVITVNHFIRPIEETCGDAAFVQKLCTLLKNKGCSVTCKIVELEKGSVQLLAEKEKTGIEAAARTLRYKAFEQFISDYNLDALCLAHNQNDQLETLIMRFLQGTNVDHSCGIHPVREKYIRPMLEISREEIEVYLKENNQDYCTDATNEDTKYFRNNIRKNLIPLLDKNFSGWKNGVLKGGQKASEDYLVIKKQQDNYFQNNPFIFTQEGLCIELPAFLQLEKALKFRVLLQAMDTVLKNNGEERIPFVFIEEVVNLVETTEKDFSKQINQLEICKKKDQLFVKKCINMNTDLVFSVIIQEDGIINLPFGRLEISSKYDLNKVVNINGITTECSFCYPVCVRNIESDDYILSASNSLKKISSILNDWKVSGELKEKIPVIQELTGSEQSVICILGKALGFKDWVLRK